MGQSGFAQTRFGLALLAAFGDDGLGGELAGLVLRPIALLLVGRLLAANLDVLVARDCGAAVFRLAVSRADLYQFGFGGDGLLHVRVHLRGVAFRIGA